MENKSIFKLEKSIDKNFKLKNNKLKNNKGYLANEFKLNKFLFRSEVTEEWVVGAKRLGKMAVDDKTSREEIENSINDNIGGDKNLHRKRHSQCALLSYYTECIKVNKKPEIELKGRNEKTVEEYYISIFEHFEIVGIQEVLKERKSFKDVIKNNFVKIRDCYIKPVQTKLDNLSSQILNKEQVLEVKKIEEPQNERTINGIISEIENYKKEFIKTNELKLLMEKSGINENEKKNIIDEIEKMKPPLLKDPKDFFKEKKNEGKNESSGFNAWEIGSLYFSFPEFYKLVGNSDNKIIKRLKDLDWNFILLGMIFFKGVESAEYLKNGVYILNSLKTDREVSFIINHIKKNLQDLLQEFLRKHEDHFAEFVFELSSLTGIESLTLICENFSFDEELMVIKVKKPKEIFRDMAKKIMDVIESSNIFESKGVLKWEKIFLSITLKSNEDYNNSLMFLDRALSKAILNERSLIPFLSEQLKYVFYKKLKKLSDDFKFKKENEEECKIEIYKQAIITSKIIAEFNTPKSADKHLGSIYANIIQFSYLLEYEKIKKEVSPINGEMFFYKRIINILLYKFPYNKILYELYAYISIDVLEEMLEDFLELIKEQNTITSCQFEILTEIKIEKLFIFNEFAENKKSIESMLEIRFILEILDSQSYEILNDERGIERLTNDYKQKSNNEMLSLERLIQNKSIFDDISLDNIKNINDEINNLNDIYNWLSKNIPFHYAREINKTIDFEINILKELKSNIESNNESNILEMYKNKKYDKHHAFLESWLGKRFLIPEIIKSINSDKNESTKFSNSFFVKKLSLFYLVITNPYISILYVFLPFVFYLVSKEDVAKDILSIQISITALLIPAIIISMIPFAFQKIYLKFKDDKNKEKNLKAGLSVVDVFYPKMLGVIFIGFLASVTGDESWAIALNSTSYFFWLLIFYLFITMAFLKKNIIDTVGDIKKQNNLPGIQQRVFRVFSIAVLQVFFISQFFIMQMSKLMLIRAESGKIFTISGSTVLNIPKSIKLKVLMPDITTLSVHFKEIIFSPFMLINTIIVILFVGVVLQLYMNKEKIN